MLNVKKKIAEDLKRIIKYLTGQDITPNLEHPKDERHGDYTSNIAMALFQKSEIRPFDSAQGKNTKYETNSKFQIPKYKTPLELAKNIAVQFMIHNSKFKIPARAEAAPPGFINFWLLKDYLASEMIDIVKSKDEYGKSKLLENKKIMVEFTDPNPFKEFHIGHLYSNTVGESICRLLESQKAIVWRVCYQGDVGLHVAKALYALLNSKLKTQNSKLEDTSLADRAKLLGEAYALGAKMYEENQEAKREIEKINKEVYEGNPSIMDIYKKGRKWSLEYFDSIYKRLGTKFKRFYFESEAGKKGLAIVKKNIGKVFKESEGAIIFPGEKYARLAARQGLHNRVFINSLGLPTYEAKDLGLAETKYKDFPYDLSIIITATEQVDYFKVVFKALSLIEPELAQKTKHISHGVVRLPMGKMSSRTGIIITGEWLLDEAKKRIRDQYKEMDERVAEQVAVGAVKYALLKSGIGRDIAFDFEESINLEGNSGPYLQYSFARTQSVLRKSEIRNPKHKMVRQAHHPEQSRRTNSNFQNTKVQNVSNFGHSNFNIVSNFDIRASNLELEPEEVLLLRAIYRFPEVVEEAAEKFAPNILCNYLFDLAQKFNLFYQKHKILSPVKSAGVNGKHPRGVIETREFRLALTMAVGQIIKNGLYLLGITTPERM